MESNPSVSAFAAIARLFWIVLGPLVLFLLAYKISQSDHDWWTPLSISYLVVVPLLIWARHIDPLDAYGEPRAPGIVRNFTVGALAVGGAVWVAAHLI